MTGRDGRPLTEMEKQIIKRLLSLDDPNASVLRQQISFCSAKNLDEFGSVKLLYNGHDVAHGLSGPFVTGQQEDVDTLPNYGPYINFVLFVDNGKLPELQIYKDDGSPKKREINPDKFIITYGVPKKI